MWSKHGHDDGWTILARVKYSFLAHFLQRRRIISAKHMFETCSVSARHTGSGSRHTKSHLPSGKHHCMFVVFRHWCSQRTKRLDNQVAPECGLHHPGITSAPLWSSARTNSADGNVGQHREETVCVQGGRPVLGRLRHPKPRMYPCLAVLSVAMGLVGRFGGRKFDAGSKIRGTIIGSTNMHAG